MRSFRLSLLEFKELEHLTEGLEGKPISLVNELKAYRGIITGLQNLYQAYGTSEQVRFTTIEKRVFKHSLTSVGGQ